MSSYTLSGSNPSKRQMSAVEGVSDASPDGHVPNAQPSAATGRRSPSMASRTVSVERAVSVSAVS